MLVPFTLQLLRECKDVLQGAVIVKQYYQYMVYAVFAEEEIMDLEQFDQDLRKMLDFFYPSPVFNLHCTY
jgi:hypothetical protein